MATDAHGMIAASFHPDLAQLFAALTRQAEAIAQDIAARRTRDSSAIWRDARLLWPAFTAAQEG
jgi:hypothetical protein